MFSLTARRTIALLLLSGISSVGCVNLDNRGPGPLGFLKSNDATVSTHAPMTKTPNAMRKAISGESNSWVAKLRNVIPHKKAKPQIPEQLIADNDPTRLDTKPKQLSADLYVAAARLSERNGQFAEALQQYNTAIKTDAKNRSALIGLARLKHRNGKSEESIQIYRNALQHYPNDAVIMNDLGLCYVRAGQMNEGIGMLRAATEAAPDREMYLNNLTAALIEARRSDDAVAHLAQQHGPAIANYRVGYLLNRAGNAGQAERYLNRALAIDPNLHDARNLLTEISPRLSSIPEQLSTRNRFSPTSSTASRLPSQAP